MNVLNIFNWVLVFILLHFALGIVSCSLGSVSSFKSPLHCK
jgi:Na+-driven multidrug efflux pump